MCLLDLQPEALSDGVLTPVGHGPQLGDVGHWGRALEDYTYLCFQSEVAYLLIYQDVKRCCLVIPALWRQLSLATSPSSP